MTAYDFVYLDINVLSKLKNSDKRKYIFQNFFNIFHDAEKYSEYINKDIFKMTGYNDIMNIIKGR